LTSLPTRAVVGMVLLITMIARLCLDAFACGFGALRTPLGTVLFARFSPVSVRAIISLKNNHRKISLCKPANIQGDPKRFVPIFYLIKKSIF
jgi:hypothetical protein